MIYKFNNIELDSEKFCLTVGSKEVSVEPQVFNLIIYLVENRNKIVSRHEILENVWEGRIVSDTSINNHIKSARKALGDDGTKQHIIKTVHSRGYQFISETKADIHMEQGFYTQGSIATIKSNRNKFYFFLFALSLSVVLALTSFLGSDSPANNSNVPISRLIITDQQVIAVLPFSNTKPNVNTDYLGFALANQIIGDLAYLDKFAIRPAGSIRKYVGEIIDPLQIGKELKVNYILNGNYLKENMVVRLNVELIKIPNNELIWRESIEVDYSNTFALQDLVASKVATGLNASFTSKGVNRRYRDVPNSALAYEYYLRGISYPFSNYGHKMAVEMLEKSIELDASYAPSYAHLGNHKRLLEQHGRIKTAGSHNIEWYYEKALDLNPELLEALNNLSAFYTETNRIEEAVIVTRKMLKINPNSATSHFSLGYIYRYAGMLEEAIREMELALVISPDNTRFRSIVATYLSAGKYKEALAKTYLDEGDYGIGHQGIIAFKQEQYRLALEHFEQVLEIDPKGIWGLIAKVYISVIKGDKKAGLEALEKMVDSNVEDAENAYYFAGFYAILDEQDKSIKMLDKAVSGGYFNYPNILSNSAFNQFQDDPTFRDILDKAKIRHDAFRARFL